MAEDLKDYTTIAAEIDAAPLRGVTKDFLKNYLYSAFNPVGVMHLSTPGTTFTGDGGWQRFDEWEGSVDTKGVQDQLGSGKGSFLIKPNGGGDYVVLIFLRFTIDVGGDVRMRPRHELGAGGSESFLLIDRDTFTADAPGCSLMVGMLKKGLVSTDEITTELYVDNGTVLTPKYGFFMAGRF